MALSDPRPLEIFYEGLMSMSWQVTNGGYLMYVLGSYFFISCSSAPNRYISLWLIMYSEYN